MGSEKIILMSTALKVLLPIAIMAVILFRFRATGPGWREKLGLCRPSSWLAMAGFVALSLVYMLATNAMWDWRGPWDFSRWHQDSWATDAGRVLAVTLLGPASEELIFRGAGYFALGKLHWSPILRVVVLAVIFGAIHYSYRWQDMLLVCGSGLLFGFGRWKTGSLWTAIAMHVSWNLYAIW